MKMSKGEFFLKNFFKNYKKKQNVDNIYSQFSKDIESYQNEIEKNIEKIGYSELTDWSVPNKKDIYDEYQKNWKVHRTVKRGNLKQLRQYLQILFIL